MSKYVKFKKEEIDRAAHASIKDYLELMGETVKPSGSEWYWSRHDSVKIRGHVWKQHSTGAGGTAIDFLCYFYDMHFTEAVITLLDGRYGDGIETPPLKNPERTKSKLFLLPPKNEDNKRLYAYLCQTRCIHHDVVNFFLKKHLIYESADHHNVVFLGKDTQNLARHAALKGTYTEKPFSGDVRGSDKAYAFRSIGKAHGLFIFESAIDLMSFISLFLMDKDWTNLSYLALSGVQNKLAIENVLSNYTHIKSLCFCFDNDCEKELNAGQNMALEYCRIYREKGYETKNIVPESGGAEANGTEANDWNDILKSKENVHG